MCLLAGAGLRAQVVDTLEVSMDEEITLIFPDSIRTDDIGSDRLENRMEVNRYFIHPVTSKFNTGSLYIELVSGHYYSFQIVMKDHPKIATKQYSFDDALGINELVARKRQKEEKTVSEPVKKKENSAEEVNAKKVMRSKSTHSDMGHISSKITLYLESIYIKDDLMYFKLTASNRSNIDYDISGLRFAIGSGNFASKQKAVEDTPLDEKLLKLVYNEAQKIEAKSKISMVYVYKKFTIARKKHLLIEMWEDGGERSLSFRVPSKELLNAKRL